MRTSFLLSVVVLLATVFAAGCGDDDSYRDRFVSKMRSCDLLTAGSVGSMDEPQSAEDRCFADCLLAASCEDLGAFVCETGVAPSLAACAQGCDSSSMFQCSDGSDVIEDYMVCDGYEDCADGSDEAGCPTFDCVDGLATIPASQVCDYYPQCEDGSDEVGCAGFECADGSGTIDPDWVCDWYDDCADGSDEVGCGGFDCADGSGTIPEDYVCDMDTDCDDGSDEVGCAQLICPQ